MRSDSNHCYAASLILGLFFAGCGGAWKPATLAPDDLQTRMMRYQQTRLHQRIFFVGIARGHDLQDATERAYGEISRQLTWLPEGAPDLLVGLYRVDRTGTDSQGQIHVLAVLEREAAARKCHQLKRETLASLGKELTRCRLLLDAGEAADARACAAGAGDLKERARTLHAAQYAAEGDPAPGFAPSEAAKLRKLKVRLDETAMRRRAVLVHVIKIVDRRRGDLNAQVQQVVTGVGLRLAPGNIGQRMVKRALAGDSGRAAAAGKAAGAGYIIIGKINVEFLGSEMGQHFARAMGRVLILETESGKVLAEVNVGPFKGGHITRKDACDTAVKNVISAAGRELAERLKNITM